MSQWLYCCFLSADNKEGSCCRIFKTVIKVTEVGSLFTICRCQSIKNTYSTITCFCLKMSFFTSGCSQFVLTPIEDIPMLGTGKWYCQMSLHKCCFAHVAPVLEEHVHVHKQNTSKWVVHIEWGMNYRQVVSSAIWGKILYCVACINTILKDMWVCGSITMHPLQYPFCSIWCDKENSKVI